ncbi:hypothetical protein K502DRAFT_32625 [Neoconidiobolus thromboides FSU 785]|nr:hypothetical protein K502DRAFT_32625 [Neoconidiobolus thromboides FSU 785]
MAWDNLKLDLTKNDKEASLDNGDISVFDNSEMSCTLIESKEDQQFLNNKRKVHNLTDFIVQEAEINLDDYSNKIVDTKGNTITESIVPKNSDQEDSVSNGEDKDTTLGSIDNEDSISINSSEELNFDDLGPHLKEEVTEINFELDMEKRKSKLNF